MNRGSLYLQIGVNAFLLFVCAVLLVWGIAAGDEKAWGAGVFALINIFAVRSALGQLREANETERIQINEKTVLLNSVIERGMDVEAAISAISAKFGNSRPPRYYSSESGKPWVEVDIPEATFVITTNENQVSGWTAKTQK